MSCSWLTFSPAADWHPKFIEHGKWKHFTIEGTVWLQAQWNVKRWINLNPIICYNNAIFLVDFFTAPADWYQQIYWAMEGRQFIIEGARWLLQQWNKSQANHPLKLWHLLGWLHHRATRLTPTRLIKQGREKSLQLKAMTACTAEWCIG